MLSRSLTLSRGTFSTGERTALVMTQWYSLLQSDSFQRLGDFSDTRALDGLGSFSGALKVSTKI